MDSDRCKHRWERIKIDNNYFAKCWICDKEVEDYECEVCRSWGDYWNDIPTKEEPSQGDCYICFGGAK